MARAGYDPPARRAWAGSRPSRPCSSRCRQLCLCPPDPAGTPGTRFRAPGRPITGVTSTRPDSPG